MQTNHHFFSMSFSGIQKSVLRHDRLWSIAGMSQILSRLNEIILPRIATDCGAKVFVAGGGKFTARFDDPVNAGRAREQAIKAVATTLPMLEFQASPIVLGPCFADVRSELIGELSAQKTRYRGYAASFNPHMRLCDECGEYPAVERFQGKSHVCSCCALAYATRNELDLGSISKADSRLLTSIQRVYLAFMTGLAEQHRSEILIPANFENLFGHRSDVGQAQPGNGEHKRMAVWFSDLNNMNTKVQVWLSRPEDEVGEIFSQVKQQNIDLIGRALRATFLNQVKAACRGSSKQAVYLPFRLVVAGGDDLCLVMPEKHILGFTANLNAEFAGLKLTAEHPLSNAWLEKHRDPAKGGEIQPYCFGGSFVVTPIHTPFRKVHHVGEDLMGVAKESSGRAANCISWRVLGVDERRDPGAEILFEKPLFIDQHPDGSEADPAKYLSFLQYIELACFYRKLLSGSHRQQLISEIMAGADGKKLESWLMKASSGGLEKALKYLLVDEHFRDGMRPDGPLNCARIATLLEIMSIANGENGHE